MKQSKALTACLLAAALTMSSCNYGTFSGLMAGSSLGGMIGGAAGYIKGGPRGHDRGTAIGILAGAATTGAVMAATKIKSRTKVSDYQDTYANNRTSTNSQSYQSYGTTSLSLQNVQFFDAQGNYTENIARNEECRVTFDIYNPTSSTIYNIEPVIYEASGNKQIAFSPSTVITNLNPGNTAHYSAIVKGLTRLKGGEATIVVGLSENGGNYVPMKQFSVTTSKK